MKHIISDDGGIDYDRYTRYLGTVQGHMPEHVFAFASDSRHFDLDSPTSLHDAWLESLSICESATGEGRSPRTTRIDIVLLGPQHDREILLRYENVARYRLSLENDGDRRFGPPSHGDLYTHEVRIEEDGMLVHELLFVDGGSMSITCRDLGHSERMRETSI